MRSVLLSVWTMDDDWFPTSSGRYHIGATIGPCDSMCTVGIAAHAVHLPLALEFRTPSVLLASSFFLFVVK